MNNATSPEDLSVYIIWIVTVWLMLAIAVGYWYRNKGGNFFAGFILAILISPLLGGLVVAISKNQTESLEKRGLDSGTVKKCPFCAELIKPEAKVCRFCSRELPQVPV